MSKNKTCILLMNMGGPTSLADVEPFLYNLFMDPDIIEIPLGKLLRPFIAKKISKKRSAKVRGYYEKIGGGSPLLKLTEDQAAALESALRDEGDFKTFVAMRYSSPFTDEAIEKIIQEKPARIILLPLYPQYSGTTSGSSINEFYRVWKKAGKDLIDKDAVEIIEIRDWYNHKGYINSWSGQISEALQESADSETHIIFSAHGIPQKLVEKGDPYQKQTEESVRLILNELKWEGKWSLSYQSKVGPVKWLEPATDSLLKELGDTGTKSVLMVPISFVSDHSETLYEMDIQYKELAKESGVKTFNRAPTANCNPIFIGALKDIVLQGISGIKE